MLAADMSTEAHIGVTPDMCVPMQNFQIFMQPDGIISMLECCILENWEKIPEGKTAVCAILSKYTSTSMQCAVVPWMSASAVFYNLNNAILYRLSCITMHDALHLIPQRYHELQFMLSQINEVFGHAIVKRARLIAEAHLVRASPGIRLDGTTQAQREQNEMYARKMQSTRDEWNYANALMGPDIQVPRKSRIVYHSLLPRVRP